MRVKKYDVKLLVTEIEFGNHSRKEKEYQDLLFNQPTYKSTKLCLQMYLRIASQKGRLEKLLQKVKYALKVE